MKITRAFDGEVVKTKNGLKALKIHDQSEAQVIHLVLEPGARLDTHTTAVDVFFYVLEGTAWIEVGDDHESVAIDSIVESPKGIPHALENRSSTETMRILVVKTPRP